MAKDDREAFAWFLRAAEQGNLDGRRAAAVAYITGEGVELDHDRATEWLIKLAVGGDEGASDLFVVLSATHWREKYEAAKAQNEAD